MRHFRSICVIACFCLSLSACSTEPTLQFEQPQPFAVTPQAEFPEALWGQYVNVQDSTSLQLTAKALIRQTQHIASTTEQELQKDSVLYRLENGRFYTNEFPEGLPVKRRARDSLFVLVITTDTLFYQNPVQQVRKFKGIYFLNQQLGPNRWKVFCLKPQGKKIIQLQYVDDSVDRLKLHEICPIREEKKVFLANPTQKELRKFLRKGGFSHREIFTKLPKEIGV
ncbi:hypothetical protein [Rufibacter immobilis]|uniref:hypothetical protein n=1 Tax=Rufibacter immobilis TaxID=1348778 RepID=UPI0035ED93C8